MAQVDATLEQEILDVPQAQREPDIHHHHEPDHLGRRVKRTERISGLAGASDAPALPFSKPYLQPVQSR